MLQVIADRCCETHCVLQVIADRCCRCVLELHAIASKKHEDGRRFAVAMTAQENERFLRSIHKDTGEYYNMLGRVNAEASDCSRASDRESIHEGIRRSVGFAKLSRMVFEVMERWIEERLQAQISKSIAAGNINYAMEWNKGLAAVLSQQGRNDEAVVVFELILNHWQRTDHSRAGGMRQQFCCELAVLKLDIPGYAMTDLAFALLKLGKYQAALDLQQKALVLQRRVLPENHPDIGVIQLYCCLFGCVANIHSRRCHV